MKFFLAWVLVTTGGYNSNQIVYSPPMEDIESCQRLQKSVDKLMASYGRAGSQCIQIKVLQ